MSQNSMSIGEPEGSQDTPMRNTTPSNRRQPRTPKPKKNQKMNQCQMAFHAILQHDVTSDRFDATYKSMGNGSNNMGQSFKGSKASIHEPEKDEDELLQLIQELEETSQTAKNNRERLGRHVPEPLSISGSRQTTPEGFVMPDYDEHHDDLIVRGCTRAFNQRTDAFNNAIANTNRQLERFQGGLGQARAEVSKQINAIRLEYEARLSQQRTDLKEQSRDAEARYKILLKEKQQIIDDEKPRTRREQEHAKITPDQRHTNMVLEQAMVAQENAELSTKLAFIKERLANAERELKVYGTQLACTRGQLQQSRDAEARYEVLLKEKQQIIDDEKLQTRMEEHAKKASGVQLACTRGQLEQSRDAEAQYKVLLKEKQQIINDEKDRTRTEERAKKASNVQLADALRRLVSLTLKNAKSNEDVLTEREKNKKLRTAFHAAEDAHAADVARLNATLRESNQELQDTKTSLVETKSRARRVENALDVCSSDYATLLIEVALVQKQKLATAKRQKLQLVEYLTKAKSTVQSSEHTLNKTNGVLKAKVLRMEYNDQQLTETRKQLELKEKALEQLERRFKTENDILVLDNQHLTKSKAELEASLVAKNELLASNAATTSDQTLEIQDLKTRLSSTAEELDRKRKDERSLCTQRLTSLLD